ncbi:MAG: hypothetical protein WCQ55_05275, partial [Paludibacteraceae bacterium]
EFVDFYNNIYKNEYREAFDIVEKGKNYTDADAEKVQDIVMSVAAEEKFVKKELIDAFKKFCRENELIISSR